jgi:hypothetical protein
MKTGEYDFEPIKGLPETLPDGETLLWQGAPSWKNIAIRAMHIRGTAIYFVILLGWFTLSKLNQGEPTELVLLSTFRLAVVASFALALMTAYAWFSGRTTVYTITSKRVVIRAGVALPKVLNLPFSKIDAANLRTYPDGSGDIMLTLPPRDRVAYPMLWPHARPWRFNRTEPMLRGLAEASATAQLLSRAVTAQAGAAQAGAAQAGAAQTVRQPDRETARAPRRPRGAALA